jgi:hypothetical protein
MVIQAGHASWGGWARPEGGHRIGRQDAVADGLVDVHRFMISARDLSVSRVRARNPESQELEEA